MSYEPNEPWLALQDRRGRALRRLAYVLIVIVSVAVGGLTAYYSVGVR